MSNININIYKRQTIINYLEQLISNEDLESIIMLIDEANNKNLLIVKDILNAVIVYDNDDFKNEIPDLIRYINDKLFIYND